MQKLLIVESPTKARKVWSLLKSIDGDGVWEVAPTMGHLVDLPKKQIGIDTATMEPYWAVSNQVQLRKILGLVDQASEVYLGTDDDREGEAIAAHLQEDIRKRCPQKPVQRVRFREVTRAAIRKAIEAPGHVDGQLYEAQIARRCLDRLVGYRISPKLWKHLGRGLSAGRVQTCVLEMMVTRELERRQHVPEPYWEVTAKLTDGKAMRSGRIDSQESTLALYEAAKAGKGSLSTSTSPLELPPLGPYTTSGLLKDAASRLGLRSEDTMRMAQLLYDQGLITYHRTDSCAMNMGFAQSVVDYIHKTAGSAYANKPRFWPSRGAHECIRPTDIVTSASSVSEAPKGLKTLYRLIWARAAASQSVPAWAVDHKTIWAMDDARAPRLEHSCRALTFDGHFRIGLGLFKHGFVTHEDALVAAETKLDTKSVDILELQTLPPECFTEATTVGTMEVLGIGRPSTYAPTVKKLIKDGYIKRVGSTLVPMMRGILLAGFVRKCMPEVLDVAFTKEMERRLDMVLNEDDLTRKELLHEYNAWLDVRVDTMEGRRVAVKERCVQCNEPLTVAFPPEGEPSLFCNNERKKSPGCGARYGLQLDKHGRPKVFTPHPIEGKCEDCGNETLRKLTGKFGPYIRCDSCKKTMDA